MREISVTKPMVTKVFDHDRLDGRTIKAFRQLKRKLRRKLMPGGAAKHSRDGLMVN
jgi:exosome complex RNA-binding protein Rrp42 (RNase PH superfamily)